MARINIEDSIMEKAGFQKLMIKLGDRHKAMGVVWDLWRLAQKYWFPEKRLIPFSAFEEADLPECLFDAGIGLAEKRADGIYAKGSEEQFSWLFDSREQSKLGGQKSAAIRKAKYGSAQPGSSQIEQDRNESELHRTQLRTPSNPTSNSPKGFEPSLLFTPYSLLSSLNSSLSSISETKKTLGSFAFDSYAEAYQLRYSEPPVRNKKVNSQFKQLADRLGQDATQVAKFYLTHNDFLYTKSMHTVDLLLRDAEKLRTEWATGNRMTTSKAKSAETVDHYQEQIEMVKRGEL